MPGTLSTWPLVPAPSRVGLGLAYSLFFAAGIWSLLWPVQSVASSALHWQALAWTGFFTLGGATCAVGAITDRWLGELAGLPLLVTVFVFFSVAAFAQHRLTSIAGGCFLLAVAALLYVRWRQVWGVRRLAAEQHVRR